MHTQTAATRRTTVRRTVRGAMRPATSQRREITIGYGQYVPALTVSAVRAERMSDDGWPAPAECPFYE